jgi:hypothetical protein
MKKRIILIFIIALALLLLYIHHHGTRLAVTAGTQHAALVQNGLKSAGLAASIEQNKPQATGKIDLLMFNDPLFHKELMQLRQRYTGSLGLYERKTGVSLSAKQQSNIARALAEARLSQMLYEAEIAQVDDSNPNLVKISVPAYADEGAGLRDFLIDKITKYTGDPALAQALADDMGRNLDRYGAYSQKMELTQMPEAIDGVPVTAVTIATQTMAAPGIPTSSLGSFPRGQMQDYTPFEAFLK